MDASSDQSFAELLRRARREAGVTQEQLAEMAGISTRAVSDLERGINRAPQQETLRLLAEALQLSDEDRRTWTAARRRLARRTDPEDREYAQVSPPPVFLSQPLSSFVGREREVASVVELLRRPGKRLVTLAGPGGVGKTRLALAVGQAVESHYPDGVWFVDLAPLHDPKLVLTTIAATLGVRATGRQTALTGLTTALRNARRLILLDNLEQVASCASDLADLLLGCPGLVLLATSRVPLRIRGEHEYTVEPFPVPAGRATTDLDRLRRSPAVELFEQRARGVSSDFMVTDGNADSVTEICRRVDGLPLAIELVAARIRLLPPSALLARLDRRLSLLTGAAQDVPLRQQTLRNTISWSYELLDPGQQRLFRALGVFHGGWTLEAVEAICGGPEDEAEATDLLGELEALIAHNLVRMQEQQDGEPRYSMLETITEFARERLDASDEALEICRRHAQFFVDFIERAEPHIHEEDQAHWLSLIEVEYPNLRAAMQWANERVEHGDTSAVVTSFRLTTAHAWFWYIHGYMPEGQAQLVRVMEQLHAGRASLQVSMTPEDWAGMYARALFFLGVYTTWPVSQDVGTGWSLLVESLETYRDLDQRQDVATTLTFLGYVAQSIGGFAEAEAYLLESLATHRELDDGWGAAMAMQGLGMIGLRTGDYERSTDWLRQSVAGFTERADVRSVAASRATLGAARLRHGDLAEASELFRESLRSRFQIGDKGGIAWCLEWMAETALATRPPPNGPAHAARLLGAASALRVALASPIDPVDQPGYERLLSTVQAEMSDPAFVAAWEAGRAMTVEDVVALALDPDRDATS